jgi:iron complex transport system ATP-binding protein
MTVRLRSAELRYSVRETTLVDGVTIDVVAGEVLAVCGPNGAGKSTLLRLLAGEIDPTAGTVEIDGAPIGGIGLEQLARLRALLPQQPVLRFGFRCIDVVKLGRFAVDESAVETDEAAAEALAATDTAHLAQRRYPTLSGGEQARVAFARVLAQSTPLLLLDEPTASLDLRHQHLVMNVLRQRADGGAAVVVVLHDINLAARYADQMLMMTEGNVHAVGTPDEVVRADLIAGVYGIEVDVLPHPTEGYPLIIPIGEPAA